MRSKPKKKANRYNPNNPSYAAVHRPVFHFPTPVFGSGVLFAMMANMFRRMGRRKRA